MVVTLPYGIVDRLNCVPIYRESDPRRVVDSFSGRVVNDPLGRRPVGNHGRGFAQGDFAIFEMASNKGSASHIDLSGSGSAGLPNREINQRSGTRINGTP